MQIMAISKLEGLSCNSKYLISLRSRNFCMSMEFEIANNTKNSKNIPRMINFLNKEYRDG